MTVVRSNFPVKMILAKLFGHCSSSFFWNINYLKENGSSKGQCLSRKSTCASRFACYQKKKMKEKIKNVQTFKLKFKVKSFKVKTIERTMGVNS